VPLVSAAKRRIPNRRRHERVTTPVLGEGLNKELPRGVLATGAFVGGTAVAALEVAKETSMRRLLFAIGILLTPAVASAQNITVRDIIDLSKAGLGEQALVALIEVNPTVFPVDVETLKSLKAAGVSPTVITAMIKSGRTPPPPPQPLAEPAQVPEQGPAQASPPPQVVVIDHADEPRVREVAVAVPVYVAVPVHRTRHDDDFSRVPVSRPPLRPVEPVYWGWGGKLRPDAWKPTIELQRDARIEIQRK